MPRIGPVAVTSTLLAKKTMAGTTGATFTVTLPTTPPSAWQAIAVFNDGTEMPCTRAALSGGPLKTLTVTVDNLGMWTDRSVASIAVDY